jgi:hypothetical protein
LYSPEIILFFGRGREGIKIRGEKGGPGGKLERVDALHFLMLSLELNWLILVNKFLYIESNGLGWDVIN